MANRLDELLHNTQDVLEMIEATRREVDEAASEITGNVEELAIYAGRLESLIADARDGGGREPVTAAAIAAIAELRHILTEVDSYFAQGRTLAAYGALVLFERYADDLKACCRLHEIANRGRPS